MTTTEGVVVEVRGVFEFADRRDYERWKRGSYSGVLVPATATCISYQERVVEMVVGEVAP